MSAVVEDLAARSHVFGPACAVAIDLRWRGLQPGDRVVLAVGSADVALVLFHAVLLAGCVAVPIDARTTCDDALHVLADAAPRLVYLDASTVVGVARAAEIRCVATELVGNLALRPVATCAPVQRDEGDLAALVYRSGRAGRPTALTHRCLSSGADLAGLAAPARVLVNS